jgi:hypothetical protein
MKSKLLGCVFVGVSLVSIVSGCETRKSPTEPTPPCTFALSSSTATLTSDGGESRVTIDTQAGCVWTAASTVGWITVTAGASGSGPGTVTYSVTANAAANPRTGTMTIAAQTYTVTQDARPPVTCTYDLSPAAADFTKDGGTGTFAVATPAGCAWTARSSAGWVSVNGDGQGSGPGSISFAVARQTDAAARTATIDMGGRSFTVRQSGDVGACLYSAAPVAFSPCMAGGAVSVSVTTQNSCPWTATAGTSWLSVVGGASGNGSGSISIAYTDNYDDPRDDVVMVRWPTPTAGQNIHVAQAGCRYAVSRRTIDMVSAGGSASFDVIQQSDPTECGGATQDRCVWTARSEVPWITITSSMPRSGDNPVAFVVLANDSTSIRTGTIVVRDQVVTVTQTGR